MNPSPDQKNLILNKLNSITYSNITDAVNQLNEENIDNPEPIQNIAKQYTWADIIASINVDRLKVIMTLPITVKLIEQFNLKDASALSYWITALHLTQYILDDDMVNINAVISATEPDPNYKTKVSWAYINIGRNVDGFDVMEALNGNN